MDLVAQAWFEVSFELMFLKARGDEFQKLLGRVMGMTYPGDFVQTRPWGKRGDEKCDGYLRSQRRFFQCYAPNEVRQAETLRKLNDDFDGALPHAKTFFDTWVFAHNSPQGRIPTWLVRELETLSGRQEGLTVAHYGFEEMRKQVAALSGTDLVSLLGPPVTQHSMMSLGYQHLQPLLAYLASQAAPQDVDPHPVPAEKLEYNLLGPSVETLLKAGMTRGGLVRQYLARNANKELGMRVATAFRAEYQRLMKENLGSTAIFDRLRQFAIGPCIAEAHADVASLAVLAFLFEECDIFENPDDPSNAFAMKATIAKARS